MAGVPHDVARPARSDRPHSAPPVAPRAPAGMVRRFLVAYAVTFRVIASYALLRVRGRFFGRRMTDEELLELHRRNARLVLRTILDLQGLFIKVGQLISIMTNFLPEAFRAELERLQDQVPPRPYEQIAGRIREEFGKAPEEVFASFNPAPLASASLGQVHAATLGAGERVAVKVQHLDIDKVVRVDLKTIRRILSIVQRFVPVQGLDSYYHQIREMILAELDFDSEASNIERIAKNFAADPNVRFPKVFRDFSTKRVLTTGFVEGVKITDLAGIDALGVDRKELARRVLTAYCQMIFVDGVYHADPHPGNILVQGDGGIVFLDFGATATLSPSMREGIPEFLEGVIKRDTEKIIASLRKMGFIARTGSDEVSERVIEHFHRRFQEEIRLDAFNLRDIRIDPQKGIESLVDLRKMGVSVRELTGAFHVPKDWVLLERTILLLTGLCTHLDPDMNPMSIIRPYLEEFVLGKDRDWTGLMMQAVRDTALTALSLPNDMKRYLGKAMKGELELRFRGMPESARLLYALGHQVIYTLCGLASGGAAFALHLRGEHAAVRLPAGIAIAFGVLLLGSFWTARRYRRR